MTWRATSNLEQSVATVRAGIEAAPHGGVRYIAWLHEDSSEVEAFRGGSFAGFAASTSIASTPRPEDPSPAGFENASLNLSEELTAKVRSFAMRNRLTMTTIAEGACAILASRYSREDEVLFAAPLPRAPASPPASESLDDFLAKSSRVRVRVSAEEGVVAWLRDLESQLLTPAAGERAGRVDVPTCGEASRGVRLSESLVLFETVGGDEGPLSLRVFANRLVFDPAAVSRMLGHLATLLEGIVADPEQPVSRLPLVTESERRQLLFEWNAPAVDVGERRCLFERFEEQVERSPDGIAVEFEDERLSYRELNVRANRLARHLRKLGVRPEVLVGVCLGRSLEMVVALVAVLKAGGAYLPLNPTHPPERLAFMLEDSQISILLTEKGLRESLPIPERVHVYLMDVDGDAIAREEERNPDPIGSPDNLAYVIYTSGSTGKPKGVLVTHGNVDRLFTATEPWFQFSRHDVWSLFHSYAFDFSVWELWGALRYGGRLVVVPQDVARSPESFHELLVRSGVTVLNQTPSAFRQLIAQDLRSAPLLCLRLVILGGEALVPGMLKPWFDRYGDESPRLVNMYGITETTVHVTSHRVTRSDLLRPAVGVIGRPIPDLQVCILDRYLQLCPIGVTGELYVAGAGLARGYLSRPELTRERFLPNPFASRFGERLYRSGDLGRYLPDGEIEYLGRLDDQVKIRGHRIELGEIESVLREHPAVREAAVIARDEAPGDRRLVAYLVGAKGARPPESEIRAFLKRLLPDYMMPSAFVPLDAFPLTSNGKIDRNALASLDASKNAFRETALIEPRKRIEEDLTAIWSQVLRVDRVGIEDDFVALGGHSLLATQMISRIRDAFRVELPMRAFFENPTVAVLAAEIEAAQEAGSGAAPPRIAPVSREARLRDHAGSVPTATLAGKS